MGLGLKMWAAPKFRVPFGVSPYEGFEYFGAYIGVPLLRETTT